MGLEHVELAPRGKYLREWASEGGERRKRWGNRQYVLALVAIVSNIFSNYIALSSSTRAKALHVADEE